MSSRAPRYTVSGPGIDRPYADPGPALSAAITFATREMGEATFYVRDPLGAPLGRVEREQGGRILIYRREGGTK